MRSLGERASRERIWTVSSVGCYGLCPMRPLSTLVLGLLLSFAFACSGSEDPAPDEGGNPTQAKDAAGAAKETTPPTACFSNHDCPAEAWCQSQDDSGEKVFCVAGARGTRQAGEACATQQECASALCIESDTAGQLCSDVCQSDSDCPAALPRCLFIGAEGAICAPPRPAR